MTTTYSTDKLFGIKIDRNARLFGVAAALLILATVALMVYVALMPTPSDQTDRASGASHLSTSEGGAGRMQILLKAVVLVFAFLTLGSIIYMSQSSKEESVTKIVRDVPVDPVKAETKAKIKELTQEICKNALSKVSEFTGTATIRPFCRKKDGSYPSIFKVTASKPHEIYVQVCKRLYRDPNLVNCLENKEFWIGFALPLKLENYSGQELTLNSLDTAFQKENEYLDNYKKLLDNFKEEIQKLPDNEFKRTDNVIQK